jgi:hypothetical protein
MRQLINNEPWEVRRFHIWYMEAAKVGLWDFVVKVPGEYFHLPYDAQVIVDFHNMYRLLQWKDLDIAQVTLFALEVNYDFRTIASILGSSGRN